MIYTTSFALGDMVYALVGKGDNQKFIGPHPITAIIISKQGVRYRLEKMRLLHQWSFSESQILRSIPA